MDVIWNSQQPALPVRIVATATEVAGTCRPDRRGYWTSRRDACLLRLHFHFPRHMYTDARICFRCRGCEGVGSIPNVSPDLVSTFNVLFVMSAWRCSPCCPTSAVTDIDRQPTRTSARRRSAATLLPNFRVWGADTGACICCRELHSSDRWTGRRLRKATLALLRSPTFEAASDEHREGASVPQPAESDVFSTRRYSRHGA